MSAEQYDWLRASAKRGHRTDDATNVVINAVERAEMDVEHKRPTRFRVPDRSGMTKSVC